MSNALKGVHADSIFMGGDIITVDDSNSLAEALAVKDGIIKAVGKRDDVLQLKGQETRIIDLAGKTLMPGFVEPHSHPVLSSFFYDFIDVSGFTHESETAVMDTLRNAAPKAKPGEWIAAFGYDPVQVRDLKGLNANILDEISSTNPVFVMQQNMHTNFVNHKAFEVLGITNETPQPDFGEYAKDEKGNLTGLVIEQGALLPICYHISRRYNHSKEFDLLEKQMRRYAKVGYTTVGDMGTFQILRYWEKILKELVTSDDCPIRINVVNTAWELEKGVSIDIGVHGDYLKEGGVKFWYDGSFLTGNVFLEEPYLESELMIEKLRAPGDNWRHGMMPKESLRKLVQKYHDQGQQVIIHAQGDRAIRDVIDVYEDVLKVSPRDDHRHRIEHCGLFPIDEMERAGRLGLTPSFMITYLYHYGEAIRDEILGPERANVFMPIGTANNSGLRTTFHNDSPMFPPEPLKLMQTAVTRKNNKGETIGEDQAINMDEAIKAITINAAYQLFLEEKVGSLEVGKLADLVVLSENPLNIDPNQLDQIQVVETYREGKRFSL